MCGRYTLIDTDKLANRFDLEEAAHGLKPEYNIAPSRAVPVIAIEDGKRKLENMAWGLIPAWAKDPQTGNKPINARAENAPTSPVFRVPFRRHRCLVPASGFYEWQKLKQEKIPYYIHLKHVSLFAFAGLFDIWKDEAGKEIRSYTIITTEPNNLILPIHDRMPVIVHKEDESTWLDPEVQDPDKLTPLLRPYAASEMEAYTISKAVNKPTFNSPQLLQPENYTDSQGGLGI